MDDYKDMYTTPPQFPDPAAPIPPETPEDVQQPMPGAVPPMQGTVPPMPGAIPQQNPMPTSSEEIGRISAAGTPVPPQNSGMPSPPPFSGMPRTAPPPWETAGNIPPRPPVYGTPPGGNVPPQPPLSYSVNVPPQPVPAMNKKIFAMAGVAAVLVFLLSAYCILSDILHGAAGSGDTPQNVTVELKTQKKPELDKDDSEVTADGEYTVRGVAELVKPSIVEVHTYGSSNHRDLSGTGSGIIISEDGYILTNAHVVQGESFEVLLDDEEEYDATLVGSDTKTDLAVLRIHADGLTAAVLGDSDETYVGENVVAIGNPAGLTNTVTKGIVSAIGRQVRADSSSFKMECIQTDAAISPGNSGGALVNMYGQVIGITSSKYASSYSSQSNAYEGLGFAITINEALPVITDLIENGYVEGRFRIGITLSSGDTEYVAYTFAQEHGTDIPAELKAGIYISEISDDCSIADTELAPGDFILRIEGQPVGSYDEVLEVLNGYHGGDSVTADCARYEDGSIREFKIRFELEEDTSGNY